MKQVKASSFLSPAARRGWILIGFMALLLCFPVYVGAGVVYAETKGPFKNWAQAVDLDGDGDLDVLVSHTRWETVNISWAGIGRWINQGDGRFELARDTGTDYFSGFAAHAGDIDQDQDADVFVQEYRLRLLENQGGRQGGEPGQYRSGREIDPPPAYAQGYRDMGGTIAAGDLNGDGRLDAFIAGCCYGLDPTPSGSDLLNAPSASWVWINHGREKHLQMGQVIPLDFLEGRPIRQAALGDVDGDGDLDVIAAVGKPTLGTVAALDDLILFNDGTGRLAASDQSLGDADSASVALGDVNGDGRLDALVGTSAGAELWINQGVERGGPIFVPAEQSFEVQPTVWGRLQAGFSAAAARLLGLYPPVSSLRAQAVFLADLDGDADLDALIARVWGAEIWWNDGQGAFDRSHLRFKYNEDTGVALGDFDADGDPDIFTGSNRENQRVWWNDGQGAFTAGAR